MGNKEFTAVQWSPNQLIDEDSLDQLNNNSVWLRDQSVDGKYQHLNNGVVDKGIKLLVGRKQVTPRKKDVAIVRIGFAKMFTPRSIPVVTTAIVSPNQAKIFSVINGIGQLHPNHTGFECKIEVAATTKKNDKIAKSLFVNWHAIGY